MFFRSLAFLVLPLLLAAGVWYFFPAPASAPSAPSAPAAAFVANSEREKPASLVRRVQELYQNESKRIGKKDPDPKLTEKRLRAVARTLEPEEIGWLTVQAVDIQAEDDGRFFATYLLGLAELPLAAKALGEIASLPLPQKRQALEAELRSQAVAGLSRACRRLPEAKDGLLEVVSRQEEEALRDRAHRALYECESKPAKAPSQAKDREGLERALYGK